MSNSAEIRLAIRAGLWRGPTLKLAPGSVQANMVVLPRNMAFEFLLFCQRNSKACPILDVTEPGSPEPRHLAPGADLRTDLPSYRVFRNGELCETITDISTLWRDDLVAFLLGCQFPLETALQDSGVPPWDVPEELTPPNFISSLQTKPSGLFMGPLVVSMRPVPDKYLVKVVEVSKRFPLSHGVPIHIGDPKQIGIDDLAKPDFGDPVPMGPNETPVFWACGVTPLVAARNAKAELLITHNPGHMFIGDWHYTQIEEK